MITEWHVAFLDREHGGPRRWWDVFTRPGWRHVLMFGYHAAAGAWVVIDPLWGGVVVDLLSQEEFACFLTAIAPRLTACLRARPASGRSLLPRIGGWCVPVVSSVLGMPPGALTPRGLYRQLIRRGAAPSFKELLNGGNFQSAENAKA